MRRTGIINHRSRSPPIVSRCEERRNNGGKSSSSSVAPIYDSHNNHSAACTTTTFYSDIDVISLTSNTMGERWLLRLVRIGFVIVFLVYAWSSSGASITTAVSSTNTEQFEMDVRGGVRRAEQQQQQQRRRQQHQNHNERVHALKHHTDRLESYQQEKAKRLQQQQYQNQQQYPSLQTHMECGLYLAPSTLPGAGLGVFSATKRSEGELIGTGELVIPIVDLAFYNGNKYQLFNPFLHYSWRGREKGVHRIVADHRSAKVQAIVPGLDAATNCNLALINVGMSGPEYDDGNLHRSLDPMAGGMTPYHTQASPVVRDLPAGGELFKFYGDRWFIGRQEQFGLVPLFEDYPAAQVIVNKFDKLRHDLFPSSPELEEDLWSLLKDTIGKDMWESRIMNALPQSSWDARKAAESDIASLHQPHAIRSLDYLKEHGKCMDSIRPGPSSLASGQAGRGAFATRNMARGTIITGTPLHHIPQKELVTMFRMELNNTDQATGEEVWLRHMDDIIGFQMILNYCFGHPETTLLLCPYGASVGYINHNQTLTNVKIQWGQHGKTSHNATWLHTKRVEDLEWDHSIGLAFDYVATKDIEEGEELFLDYGDEFEEALKSHLAKWKPPQDRQSRHYIPAERFNKQVADLPLRTVEEQAKEPYPKNLQMRCHPDLATKKISTRETGNIYWETREEGYECRILERYGREGDGDNVSVGGFSSEFSSKDNVYRVEVKVPLDEDGSQQQRRDAFTYIQRKSVPRSAITFFNIPYTSDLFLPNVFRKEMGIPDSMVPVHWRNVPPRRSSEIG